MSGLEQIGIGIFGVAAIWLSQDSRERVRRWSCIAGLCAQPFWFYTTAVNGQWGIFALSFFYTWSWWKGVRTYWLRMTLHKTGWWFVSFAVPRGYLLFALHRRWRLERVKPPAKPGYVRTYVGPLEIERSTFGTAGAQVSDGND